MLERLFDAYNEASQRLEDLMFEKVLPIMFKFILFGMKLTLVWAAYLMVTEVFLK